MQAWICLGSNLENPPEQLKKALSYLREKCYLQVLRVSSMISSEPYGYKDQPDFANQLIEIETELTLQELLVFLQNAEQHLGRTPTFRWGPRLIDLDLILAGNQVIETETLQVPHPGIVEREYLLRLLAEMIPDHLHPVTGETFLSMYENIRNRGKQQ